MADAEDGAELLVFLYNAFTVDQSEAMRLFLYAHRRRALRCCGAQLLVHYDLSVEQAVNLFLCHAAAAVRDTNLYRLFCDPCFNTHMAPRRCKMACVLGKRVEHEERERAVGFYHSLCRHYLKGDVL